MPEAHACGRAAVGYAIGNGVSSRRKPAKTSGSDQSKNRAAWKSVRAITSTSPPRPLRHRPQAPSDVSCGQTVRCGT